RIEFNDIKRSAYKLIKENLRQNALKGRKIRVHNEDANIFLLKSKGFNYIDIDPFGSPNQFLDSGIKRLSSDGYLAVTCTDTASLSGTYPKTCLRKYWAMPRNDSNMHETGIRILIRKIQLIGSQYHKALFPVLSYSHKHYFRVYFKCENSKSLCNNIISQHRIIESAGPMWLGNLWELSLINKMRKNANDYLIGLLEVIKEEAEINVVGFFDIHEICQKYKVKNIPKTSYILQEIRNQNYKAGKTHFSDTGIRTNIKLRNFVRIISAKTPM
ncbi:MAG: hypothetical protein AABY14_03495, partial [Nanoarchaeota archaeon]